MSETCLSRNPVSRDGTSQQQRLLKALLPDYVAVDERKIDDLKNFVLSYSKELIFYNLQNEQDGNWEPFFAGKQKKDDLTDPHYALFLAFLELFKVAQADLNTLTRRHLDFYYKELLHLEERPAEADQVFIIFELARHVTEKGHLVEKGTLLKAGKDAQGKEVAYETDDDIVVNKAQVADIKSLLRKTDSNNYSRIYVSPIAKSSNGEGAEITSDALSWKAFGDTTRKQAEVGFAVASPLLFLAEGYRTVTLQLSLQDLSPLPSEVNPDDPSKPFRELTEKDLADAFKMYFSGEEEWIQPLTWDQIAHDTELKTEDQVIKFLNEANNWIDIAGIEPQSGPVYDNPFHGYVKKGKGYDIGEATAIEIINFRKALPSKQFTSLSEVRAVKGVGEDKINDLLYSFLKIYHDTLIDFENRTITIIRTLGKDQPSVVAYNQEVLINPFTTSRPVAKVVLNTYEEETGATPNYIYDHLNNLKITKADLTVRVSQITNLVVQNDQTVMDPAKVFSPFGIIPVIGSSFYIGSTEVFQKKLDELKVNITWHGLPDYGCENGSSVADSCGFDKYYKDYLNKRTNTSFKTNISLLDKKKWVALDDQVNLFSDTDNTRLKEIRNIRVQEVQTLSQIARDPELETVEVLDTSSKKGFIRLELAGMDFGHKEFQAAYTDKVLLKLNSPTVTLPNEPYNPSIKALSIDYSSSATIEFSSEDSDKERIEQFFHLHPFGASERARAGSYLVPQFRAEGELYIGVEKLAPPQNLSILFQMLEGSENPSVNRPDVEWAYLAQDQWVSFNGFDILSDSTSGLIASGIVKLSVSKKATTKNTLLPEGYHWLRASVPVSVTENKNTGAIPELIEIATQAVVARFLDRNNDPDYLRTALEEGSIKKLSVSDSSIDKVKQPFTSFGGKIKEQSLEFYTRVSERLRHKERAVTIWDYERMVLARFPNSYKVKCLNHTRYTGLPEEYSELAPGHVSVVVISNVENQNAIDPLRPLTSLNTLQRISDYLSELNVAPITLHVKNPIYEGIRVEFKVKFKQGFDAGFYTRELEDEIKEFLSPWAFGKGKEIAFGGKVHKSVLLNFVDERPYVDFATCFKIFHVKGDLTTPLTNPGEEKDEIFATTSASILGTVGRVENYGDHTIVVLEEDDCGACEDNKVDPPVVISSVDTCPCEEDASDYDWDDEFNYTINQEEDSLPDKKKISLLSPDESPGRMDLEKAPSKASEKKKTKKTPKEKKKGAEDTKRPTKKTGGKKKTNRGKGKKGGDKKQ